MWMSGFLLIRRLILYLISVTFSTWLKVESFEFDVDDVFQVVAG